MSSKYPAEGEPEYERIPCLVTQYLAALPRTLTLTQLEGCPAKVAVEYETLIPRARATMVWLACPRALRAMAGLKASSRPSNGLEPLDEMQVTVPLLELPELPEFPEFPELPALPELAELQ